MIPGSGRLVLRIYLVTIVQLLAILLAVALVGWLFFAPPDRTTVPMRSRSALGLIAGHAGDLPAMQAEADRLRRSLGAEITLYGPDGGLLLSNVEPPLQLPFPGAPCAGPPGPQDPDFEPAPERGPQRDGARRPRPGLGRPRPDREGPHGPGHLFSLPIPEISGCGLVRLRHGPPGPPTGLAVVAVVVALLGAGVASVLLARSLSGPLSTLTRTAQALGAGDLSARSRLGRRDELGQVGEAFDEMADRLTQLLRAQQELLANVSHELRTPLARIRVALDLAAEGDSAMAKEALGEIDEDLGELQGLVTDVLAMARLDLSAGRVGSALPPLHQAPFLAQALVDKAVLRFRSARPERVLEVEALSLADVSLLGDPALLRRALDNLLDNAAEYSEPGSKIQLLGAVEGHDLVLKVIDRGIGIAEEHLGQVGTPFFRTDRSRARRTGGLGLGLSLAKRILEAHGGRLELQSQLQVGTTVTLRIPVSGTSEPRPEPSWGRARTS